MTRRRKPPSRHPGRPRRRSVHTHAHTHDEHLDWVPVLLEVGAAEARGDADGALALMAEHQTGPDGRLFWAPWRVRRLSQLLLLDGFLPRWATSRWVLDQAVVHLSAGSSERGLRALDVAISAGAGHLLPPGLPHEERMSRICDRDWVFREWLLHEGGALEAFLDHGATPDLLLGADDLRCWVGAPMGGYRLVSTSSDTITWIDLATGEQLVLDNLGAAALVISGETVIGRLVPVEHGRMFASAPLRVPSDVAEQVAADPSCWVRAIAGVDRAAESLVTGAHQHGLLHDLHPVTWQSALLDVAGFDPARAPDASQDLHEALVDATLRLARDAGSPDPSDLFAGDRDPDTVDGWPCLGAALLEPSVVSDVRARCLPGDRPAFAHLATRLAEPAATVCRLLAVGDEEVAA